MTKLNRVLVAAGLAAASLGVQAQTTYEFDSVSSVEHQGSQTLVAGILVNDTTTTTATVPTLSNNATLGSRCVPLFHTMQERPGIYRLKIITDLVPMLPDPTLRPVLVSCTLTVKP